MRMNHERAPAVIPAEAPSVRISPPRQTGGRPLSNCAALVNKTLARRLNYCRTSSRRLVKGDDFDPVRTLAGRIASDRLRRAGLGVDRVRRDGVRLLAGHDNEAAGRV